MRVNTRHDAVSYERHGYQHAILDINALYDAFKRSCRNSDWKPQVQQFQMAYLLYLTDIQKQLQDRTYRLSGTSEFILRERGKTRVIKGEHIRDRTVKHALCDNLITPVISKYLIYDNGASLPGKGVDFTRRRLVTHLSRYYRKHGNDGYILLIDFRKYYDNIRHDVLKEQYRKYIDDDLALWLIDMSIDASAVDVSYMSDKEYSKSMYTLFDSIAYEKIDRSFRTGEKILHKHLNVGDQESQSSGILYPTLIDNYVKIVRGEKYYARYMDDSYVIHESREHLRDLLEEIIFIADSIGITVNRDKTRICKLSSYWRFLQIQYSLTETGRIIRKINPKRLTVMRRKMKKLAPRMKPKEFFSWFNSWYRSQKRYMSRLQKSGMIELYEKLSKEASNDNTHIC